MSIFAIHLRLRKQTPGNFDLAALADATEGFSGAEIEQAVISALYRSLQKKQPLTVDALVEAANSTTPLSVSRAEDVDRVREIGKRFTPVR
jgi:SpoVK/Ycf46/Vps4 family AAA+-type ATPase